MSRLELLLVLCSAAFASATLTARVVVIIGQSNALGYNSEGYTNEDVTFPNILQTSCCVDGYSDNTQCKLIIGQDPLHHDCGRLHYRSIGFGMTFARELRQEIPEDDIIVLVPAAKGATGFADDYWTAYTGSGFINAQARIQSTFKLIAENYPQHTAVFETILWHQGEVDADLNTTTATYLRNDIIPMIEAWRDVKVIEQTTLTTPFVVGNLSPSWALDPKNSQRLGVFIAIQMLNQLVPYTGVAPSQGLVGYYHFTGRDARILGIRYFEAWKAAKVNNYYLPLAVYAS